MTAQSNVFVTLKLHDSEDFASLLRALSALDSGISLENVSTREDFSRVAKISLGGLTEKQRLVLAIAIDEGYYDSPRKNDLKHLATALGLSRSAVSQHLNNAEAKLVKAIRPNLSADESKDVSTSRE